MPRGPRGEKRPADVIGNAVKVMRIATGEETETLPPRSVRRRFCGAAVILEVWLRRRRSLAGRNTEAREGAAYARPARRHSPPRPPPLRANATRLKAHNPPGQEAPSNTRRGAI